MKGRVLILGRRIWKREKKGVGEWGGDGVGVGVEKEMENFCPFLDKVFSYHINIFSGAILRNLVNNV